MADPSGSPDDAFNLPHDDMAEKAVLGAMLIDNSKIPLVAPILTMHDFFRRSNGIVYWVITNTKPPVDLVTVCAYLRQRGKLSLICGPRPDGGSWEKEAYVASLVDSTHRSANAAHYAHIVKRLAVRRRFLEAAEKAIQSEAPEDLARLSAAIGELHA